MIGITLGDVTGIGPEVVVQALASELSQDATQYLVIGAPEIFSETCRKLKINLPFDTVLNTNSRLAVVNPSAIQFSDVLKKGDAKAALAAVEWLRYGAALCLNKQLQALVTAPVSKEAIISAGLTEFVGQTELLSQISQVSNTAMMLLGYDEQNRWVRVVLATTHVPIRRLADSLNVEKVFLAIQMAHLACKALGLERGKIGVCGLNPHAGEGGKIGNEEQTVIEPAIHIARTRGINVEGPFAADALFHHHFTGIYDVVVAMYHDQGLAPLKMVAFETGVNWTVGLPFIRTSPDHGTAYDIVGKNIANPSSMVSAIRLAKALAKNNSYINAMNIFK